MVLCGVSSRDIAALDDGTPLGGYWGRDSGSKGIHDPLTARALYLCSSPPDAASAAPLTATLLLALDLIGIHADLARRIRAAVVEAVGTQAGAAALDVMVCCTHTHSGPQTHSGFIGTNRAHGIITCLNP